MQPLVFEHFSLNDHNGFLEDWNILLIDKAHGSDHTKREEYWRRVLKTATLYGLSTIDWLFCFGKFWNSCKISWIFRGKCLYFVKYILLTCLAFVVFVFRFRTSWFDHYYWFFFVIIITIIIAIIVINIIDIVTVTV